MRSASAKCRAVARSEWIRWRRRASVACAKDAVRSVFPKDTAGQDWTLEFGNTTVLKPNLMKARLNVFIGTTKMLGPLLRRK